VIGTVSMGNSTNASVSLTSSATFTSGSSYECTASYAGGNAGTAAIAITKKNGSPSNEISFKADEKMEVQFICVGN
jgi:hypothetical protein